MIVECVEVVYLIYQLTTKQQKMNYELKVTEINTKAAKFLYEVIDEAGNIISQRKSNREYIYCTINTRYCSSKIGNIQNSKQYQIDSKYTNDVHGYTNFAYKK